jgi:hypothetical protein
MVAAGVAVAQPDAGDDGARYEETALHLSDWSIRAWGSERAAGAACWVRGEGGALRVEIAVRTAAAPLEALLAQRGEGWTLIVAPSGSNGTDARSSPSLFKPWDAGWREVRASVGRTATTIVDRLDAAVRRSPDCGPQIEPPRDRRRSRPAGAGWRRPGRRRRSVRELAIVRGWHSETGSAEIGGSPQGLRAQLVARGRGRGGADEILELSWRCPEDEAPYLRISSTRRSGDLRIAIPSSFNVRIAIPEAFIPIWPLGDLLEFP